MLQNAVSSSFKCLQLYAIVYRAIFVSERKVRACVSTNLVLCYFVIYEETGGAATLLNNCWLCLHSVKKSTCSALAIVYPQNTVTTWVTCNSEDNTDSPPCSSEVCKQVFILLMLSISQVEVMQFRYVSLMVPRIVSNGLTFVNVVNVSILKPLYAFSQIAWNYKTKFEINKHPKCSLRMNKLVMQWNK